MISSLQNTSVDWGYYVEKSKKVGNAFTHNVSMSSGKFIGGSGGMNVMFYVRGNNRDYDNWELAGNPSWNWQNVLPYFIKAENFGVTTTTETINEVDQLHGNSGPLHINSFVNEQPLKQTLFEAAQELGYKQLNDINGNEYIGIGTAPGTIDQGKPYNSAKAYLSPAKNRTNLHVIKYAHVNNVNVDNTTGQVTGVTFQLNKTHELMAAATKEVILSAGSIGTPKILQLSGIGPEKYMARLNISLVRNLYAGWSLQNHVTVPLFVQFNASDVQTSETVVDNTTAAVNNEIDSTDTLYDYIKQRRGVFSLNNVFDVLGFFNTVNATDAYPNIGTHYVVFKRDDNVFIGEYLKHLGLNDSVAQPIIDANKNADIAVIFTTLLNPTALGKVRLRSADPYDLPMIQSNFLDRPDDVATLVQGVQLARKFLTTQAFSQISATDIQLPLPECETVPLKKMKKIKTPTTPKPKKDKSKKYDKKNKGKQNVEEPIVTEAPPIEPIVPEIIPYGTDQYFECYVKQVSTPLYHPTSTSKMGPATDRFAVVDERLKVHTLNGLRIIDASVMPKIVSANVNAATIMIAEKGSDLIKEDWALAAAAAAAAEATATTAGTPADSGATEQATPDASTREEL